MFTFITLIIVIAIVLYIINSQSMKEMFSDIDYKAYKREKQQMFEDYYLYDYKKYDFDRISDEYGNVIKKSVDNEFYSTFVENNADYNPLEYNLATPLKTIAALNENVDLPGHTINQKKLKIEIKQNRGKCDKDTITNIPNFKGLDTSFKENMYQVEYSVAPNYDKNFDNLLPVIVN